MSRASPAKRFLIYSREHNLWWRANSAGYTHAIEEAGRYSYEDALAICQGANWRNNAQGGVSEFMMVAPESAAQVDVMLQDVFSGFAGSPSLAKTLLMVVQQADCFALCGEASDAPQCPPGTCNVTAAQQKLSALIDEFHEIYPLESEGE